MKKGYIVVPMLLSMVSTGLVSADEVVDNTNTVVTDVTVETTVSELPQVKPDTTVTTTVAEPVTEEVKPELPQVQPDTTVSTTVSETTTTTTQSVTDVVKPELPNVEPDTTVSTTVEQTTTTQSSLEDVVASPDYVVVNTTVAKVDKINYQNKEVVEKTEETTTTKEGEMKVLPNTGTEHSSLAWLGLLPFLSGAYLIKKNQKKEVE